MTKSHLPNLLALYVPRMVQRKVAVLSLSELLLLFVRLV